MNRLDLSEPSLAASPRTRLVFRACACTLLTVGACGVDERSPTLTSAGAASEFEAGLGQGGNGSPAAPSGNEAASNAGTSGTTPGDDMQGSGTEGAPEVEGINPGDGTSDEVSAGGAPIDGMPPMTSTDPDPPADSEPAPSVRPEGPCDIYAAANVPCVGAYSMVRALSSGYGGPLYQVRRGAPNPSQNTGVGGETQDIGLLANGIADAAAQDAFCGNQTCTVSALYDQSGQGNHLSVAPGGCFAGATSAEDDYESSATDAPLIMAANSVYGLYMRPHEGYRNNAAVNTPEGEEEAGMYTVAAGSGSRPNAPPACCWNFGISSRDNCFGAVGATNALFFGRAFWGSGAGAGPWFMADFETAVWAGGSSGSLNGDPFLVNVNNPSMTMAYAFGVLKTRPNNYALRMGDAQQGNLTTAYDGPTPTAMERWQVEGGIILGIAADNNNLGQGTFFEGAIVAGRPSDALDEAILQNVRAAGYGR